MSRRGETSLALAVPVHGVLTMCRSDTVIMIFQHKTRLDPNGPPHLPSLSSFRSLPSVSQVCIPSIVVAVAFLPTPMIFLVSISRVVARSLEHFLQVHHTRHR
jgi:hypothetical protein